MIVFGEHEQKVIDQLERCVTPENGARGVLCADAHFGYSQPVGGAVAYRDHISPAGVGYDIGCGNKAVATNLLVSDVGDVSKVMDEIERRISFGAGQNNSEQVRDHPVFDRINRDAPLPAVRKLLDRARTQLGTVGGGNHYVDLFREDATDRLWIGVHFGSRGFGHKVGLGFMALAQGKDFGDKPDDAMDSPPALLHVESPLGHLYVEAMTIAGEYAYAGRDVVVDKVLEILGAEAVREVHNHHNFCLPGDVLVATADGPQRMDAIKPGMVVFAQGEHGTEGTLVLDHWDSGEKPIHSIRTASRSLRCSGEHPIRVWTGWEFAWKPAASIVEGDEIVCARGYYPQDVTWGEEKARFVGAFLGDGWIRHSEPAKRGYAVGLAVGTGADEHGARYLALAGEVAPNDGWGSGWALDRPGHYGASCSARSAYDSIVDMGLGARSRDRYVPDQAFRLPRHEKLALLAGYIDADGSVADDRTSNHGRGTIASVSETLVRGLRELAIGCGLRCTRVAEEERSTNYGECVVYRCVLSADSTAQLTLWHAEKVANQRETLTRRSEGKDLGGGLFAQRVLGVKQEPAELVYDLSVAHESHSFIAEGVVTHNCWREEHFGESWWVVRKGCTPAFPGQAGFVGSTMTERSVILEGVESERSADALYSTVHGAGRAMSRTAAAGKTKKRWTCSTRDCDWVQQPYTHKPDDGTCPTCGNDRLVKRWVRELEGAIDWNEVVHELKRSNIELRGANAEEAPGAYKRLTDVLGYHEGTVRVLTTLKPIGVAMAPSGVPADD